MAANTHSEDPDDMPGSPRENLIYGLVVIGIVIIVVGGCLFAYSMYPEIVSKLAAYFHPAAK